MTEPKRFIHETALQKELSRFQELFSRLINALLNRLFDLKPESASRRRWYLIILLITIGFLISLGYYPLSLWIQRFQDILVYLLNPAYAVNYPGNPIVNFVKFVYQAFKDPRTLQYFPIFLVPFFIALQCAALYLADVFELDDISVARKFVSEIALSRSDETIRITAGDISEESRQSPNYLIGGPGKVIVDFDSVALFEKPDGTPHVIGPTGKEPGGKATLEGFERFRQAINLRDHFIPLRDQDDKSRSVASRSLDGIPISAVDVQIIFSIFRDNKKPTNDDQYPYSKSAVERLVYKSTSEVTPYLSQPSKHVFIWEKIAIGMVRGELSKFMSEKNLTEYLASFGTPEVEKAREREAAIVEETRQILPAFEATPAAKHVPQPPPFTPRPLISNLFNQFTNNFAKNANEKGIEISWTGLGTWKTPMEIVSDMHIEAWKLTRENLMRGSEEALKNKRAEAGLQAVLAMIQSVPLGVYQELSNEASNRDSTIRSLLQEYQRQIKDIEESLRKNGRRIPPTVIAALAYLFQIFYRSRVISRSTPPPETEREDQLNEELQNKIGDCNGIILYNVLEQLVELERRFNSDAKRELILEKINRDWDLDMEGKWQS